LAPLVGALIVGAASWVAVAELSAPGVPATSAPGEFSVARAMADVRFLAQVPRPMGSVGETRARVYIVGQLRSIGLFPTLQTTSVVGGFDPDNHVAATVTNIVARLPGTANTGAIAFNAHYDSVASSPGASDCGSCVASVLETARVLRAGPRLRNDVLFVFTDGEEIQDVGAHAFATHNPAMRDVSTVVNFDTSGSHGAVYLARTSPNSGDLVRQLVASSPHPRVFSFIPALMTLFRSSVRPGTDAEEYFDRGAGGVALYYSGGSTDYHTQRDSSATISPASVQQDGSYAVALARDLGNRVAPRRGGGDWVAYNIAPDSAVFYPAAVDVALAVLAIVLLGFAAAWGRRRGVVTVRGLMGGFALFPLVVLASGVVVMLVWAATKALVPDLSMPFVGSYLNTSYFLALAFAAIAAFAFLYLPLLGRLKRENLALGALAFGAAMSMVLALALPGSAYLFVVPVLVALGFRAWALSGRPTGAWHTAGAVALPLAVAVILIVPVVALLVLALGARVELQGGIPAVGLIIGLFVAGAAGLFIPYLRPWSAPRRSYARWRPWVTPGAAALCSLALLLLATASLGFDSSHPRPDTINYQLNADTGYASWLTRDSSPDGYTRQFFAPGRHPARFEFFAMSTVSGWAASAPVAPLPAPTVRLVGRTDRGGKALVRLWLASPRHAPALEAAISTGPISAASIDHQAVSLKASDRSGELKFIYWALPATGIPVTLTVPAGSAIQLTIHDISYGLPNIPGHTYKPRPADTMSGIAFAGDATMVSHTVSLRAQ
jgi:Peptidase family M28